MTLTHRLVGMAVLVVAITSVACPEPDEAPPPQQYPVDSQTFPRQLQQHLDDQHRSHLESTRWIEDTRLWQQLRLPPVDRPAPNADRPDRIEALSKYLAESVFIDDQITDETETSITYELDGARVCSGLDELLPTFEAPSPDPGHYIDAFFLDLQNLYTIGDFDTSPETPDTEDRRGFDGDERRRCVETVNAAQIRLHVTSPSPDEFRIALSSGDDRHQPLEWVVSTTRSLVDIDIADTADAFRDARHIADIDTSHDTQPDGAPQPPSDTATWSGRLQWSFQVDRQHRTTTRLHAVRPLRFHTDGARLAVAAGAPLFEQRIDAANREAMTAYHIDSANFELAVDDGTDAPSKTAITVEELRFEAQLTGDDDDLWKAPQIGLGQPLVISVDDSPVLSIHRQTPGTERVDAALRTTPEGPQLQLQRGTEWTVDFQFGEFIDDDSLFNWLADDTWSFELSDQIETTIAMRDLFVLEVVDGSLTWHSTAADTSLNIASGECLMTPGGEDDDQEPGEHTVVAESRDASSTTLRSPEHDSESDRLPGLHPFFFFEVGPCP